MMNNKSTRLESVDALRGIAILAVIFFHYVPYLASMYHLELSSFYQFYSYGKYGVHLFFIISGFVIYMTILRAKSPLQFAVSRFSRLYPAFWLSVILSSLLIITFGHPYKHDFSLDLSTFMMNMSMLQRFFMYPSINGVYWTLTFELMFYFYMGLIMMLGFQKRSFYYSVIWLLVSISLQLYANNAGIQLSEALKGVTLLEFNSYFLTGIALFNYQNDRLKTPILIILLLSLLPQYLVSGMELVVVFVVTTSLFFIFSFLRGGAIRLFSSVGRVSYSLYLIHSIPGYVLMSQLNHLGISLLPNIVISLSLVFVSAGVIFKFIELPSQLFLRHWFSNLLLKTNAVQRCLKYGDE